MSGDLPLLYYPDPRLQIVCEPLDISDVMVQAEVALLLARMWDVLKQHNGWGLAAPQLGSPVRAIIVHAANGCKIEIINPEISLLKRGGTFNSDEGCLSYPGKRVTVRRHNRVKVKGFNRWGEPVTFGGKHYQAAALQHECEHLEGINIADHCQ